MPRVNKIKQICKECGKSFESWTKQSTCSRKCGMEFRSREYKKGRVVKCNWCGKLLYRMPSKIKRYNFCNPDHQHKFNKKDPNMSKGWHQSEEAIKKIKQALSGKKRVLSSEARKKMSEAAKERNLHWTLEQREKMRQHNLGKKYSLEVNASKRSKDSKNGMWKDDKASYQAKHMWIYVRKGKPQKCQDCGITSDKKKIEWSNVDHKYRRNLDDYVSRCVPCHRRYDIKNGYRVFGRIVV